MPSGVRVIVLTAASLWAAESDIGVGQLLQTLTDGIESGYGDADLGAQSRCCDATCYR